ncbi:MAG: hypothetical protein HOQ05_00715 [Corynebacteriales bacterium]|nr:hypothetical protein [Mycobacteriales bacterium]
MANKAVRKSDESLALRALNLHSKLLRSADRGMIRGALGKIAEVQQAGLHGKELAGVDIEKITTTYLGSSTQEHDLRAVVDAASRDELERARSSAILALTPESTTRIMRFCESLNEAAIVEIFARLSPEESAMAYLCGTDENNPQELNFDNVIGWSRTQSDYPLLDIKGVPQTAPAFVVTAYNSTKVLRRRDSEARRKGISNTFIDPVLQQISGEPGESPLLLSYFQPIRHLPSGHISGNDLEGDITAKLVAALLWARHQEPSAFSTVPLSPAAQRGADKRGFTGELILGNPTFANYPALPSLGPGLDRVADMAASYRTPVGRVYAQNRMHPSLLSAIKAISESGKTSEQTKEILSALLDVPVPKGEISERTVVELGDTGTNAARAHYASLLRTDSRAICEQIDDIVIERVVAELDEAPYPFDPRDLTTDLVLLQLETPLVEEREDGLLEDSAAILVRRTAVAGSPALAVTTLGEYEGGAVQNPYRAMMHRTFAHSGVQLPPWYPSTSSLYVFGNAEAPTEVTEVFRIPDFGRTNQLSADHKPDVLNADAAKAVVPNMGGSAPMAFLAGVLRDIARGRIGQRRTGRELQTGQQEPDGRRDVIYAPRSTFMEPAVRGTGPEVSLKFVRGHQRMLTINGQKIKIPVAACLQGDRRGEYMFDNPDYRGEGRTPETPQGQKYDFELFLRDYPQFEDRVRARADVPGALVRRITGSRPLLIAPPAASLEASPLSNAPQTQPTADGAGPQAGKTPSSPGTRRPGPMRG